MKLYHASLFLTVFLNFIKLFPDINLNILISYAILNSDIEAFCKRFRDKIDGLILDSGTWTANHSKSVVQGMINLKGYIRYLLWFKELFDGYFNFDIDHSEKGSETNLDNQLQMEAVGLRPIPVIHQIYGDEISFYIDQGYKHVALGSAQIRTEDTLEGVMDKLEPAGVDVHLFGHTKFDLIANFPIASCDSTAWATTGSYGHIKYWNPKKDGVNKTDQIYLDEYMSSDKEHKVTFSNYEFREDLENYLHDTFGLTYLDLLGHKGAYNKMLVNTYYFVQLERIVNQIHREKGFKTAAGVEI